MEKQMEQSVDILREELPMQRFVGMGLSQAVVEGEVALPGGLREETRVLVNEAMAVLERANAENGRVQMDGKVAFHVMYTQGDPTKVSALEASADFTHTAEVPGVHGQLLPACGGGACTCGCRCDFREPCQRICLLLMAGPG